uniref:penicillin-binding protein 1C n=1 Tax=Fusobacterium mortiferum TaxID=850 RepID=UPI003FED6CF4
MRKLRFLPLILIIPIIFCIKIYREFDVEKMRDEIEKRYSQVVLDDRDNIIGAYLNSEEQWQIKGVEIPPRLKLAVLNYEDRKFYSHNGVDYLAIVRAVKTNLLEKRRVGASTITMQGVKLYKRRERTYLSKIEEIIESYKLEKYLSKDEILELYLNNAPYGSNIVGYETASQLYFGKSAKNLTWAEGATLAVLPNSPGLIWIEKNRDKLLNKRNNLLKNMYERGVIDEKQYRLSIKEELPKERKYFNSLAPHLTRRLVNEYEDRIIKSTINSELQKNIERIAREYGDYLNNRGIKNTAIIVVDNHSGEVKSYVGSQNFYDFQRNGQVDGVVAQRSVGSVLKPFLYALSIDEGLITPKSKLLDVPLYFSNFNPQNANKKYQGLVEARETLKKSLNIPFVKLLDEYGVDKFFYFLKDVVNFPERDYSNYGLSLILGTKEMSVENIAKLYHGLSQYGEFKDLKYIRDDKKIDGRKLISKGASYLTLEAMQGVQRYGIDNLYLGRDGIAWKTGTSYGQRDAWAGGISSRWTVVVWCGNFTGEGNRNISGVVTAGQLLFKIFKVLPNENESFIKPNEELKKIKIDSETGYRLRYDVPSEEIDYPKDAKNLKVSPYYKKVFINSKGEEIDSRNEEFIESKEKIVLSYPIELLDYMARENISISNVRDEKIKIIYPLNNIKIFLPKDFEERKSLIVKVANPKNKKLYWYHNGKYIFSGRDRERAFDFLEGEHRLTLVSESGEVVEVKFYILRGK